LNTICNKNFTKTGNPIPGWPDLRDVGSLPRQDGQQAWLSNKLRRCCKLLQKIWSKR